MRVRVPHLPPNLSHRKMCWLQTRCNYSEKSDSSANNMGCSSNGKTSASKTLDDGSIPSLPAIFVVNDCRKERSHVWEGILEQIKEYARVAEWHTQLT